MIGSTEECDHHGDHWNSNYQMAGYRVLQVILDNVYEFHVIILMTVFKMILVEVNIQCV